MSQNPVIDAKVREDVGRQATKRLRKEGFVPAILYAHRMEPTALQIPKRQIRDIIHEASSGNFVVDINIEGGNEKGRKELALLQEMQMDPLSKQLLHVDFHGIKAGEEIVAEVALESEGTAAGISEGGILDQILYSLEVKCIPSKLPDIITVDVSEMNLNDTLHVGDLKLPEGVTATAEAESPVFALTEPSMEPEPEETAVATEPEVIGEGGPEEGEEGEEAPEASAETKAEE
jgi:large subunit ribosomal protein L25